MHFRVRASTSMRPCIATCVPYAWLTHPNPRLSAPITQQARPIFDFMVRRGLEAGQAHFFEPKPKAKVGGRQAAVQCSAGRSIDRWVVQTLTSNPTHAHHPRHHPPQMPGGYGVFLMSLLGEQLWKDDFSDGRCVRACCRWLHSTASSSYPH